MNKLSLRPLWVAPVLLGLHLNPVSTAAQQQQAPCSYLPGIGCSGTNLNNYGANSGTDASTIEYDNFVSTFHSSIIREYSGDFKVWGEKTAAASAANLTVPSLINNLNYPGLTGRILKASMGSNTTSATQGILLTTTGLFAWGTAGGVLSTTIKSTPAFQKITGLGNEFGLPGSVRPEEVKSMFATFQTLAIVTCSGEAYVLSQQANMRGNGATGAANTWARVQQTGGAALLNVSVLRGSPGAMMALTNDGNVWTWGVSTWLGNATAGNGQSADRTRATLMIKPVGAAGTIKMIGVTGANSFVSGTTASTSYYLLYANGNLYSLGKNTLKELGDWTTIDKTTWVQPRYTSASGPVMNNITWISPNEHDNAQGATINVLTNGFNVYNWGSNGQSSLGRGTGTANATVDPGTPGGLVSTDKILAIETGGHTTMIVKNCVANYGYVGHQINGSVGNNTEATANINTFSYSTPYIQICGATTVPQINTTGTPSFGANGLICSSTSVQLAPTPAGGTLRVASGPGTLSGTQLSFTGAGNVTVEYTVSVSECGAPVTSTRVFSIESCTLVNVSGRIWNDANGNAVVDPGETAAANGLWANLVAPNGLVVSSVKVNADGTYTVSTPGVMTGNYQIILTNTENYVGKPVSSSDTPAGGYGYTGSNVANTGNPSNRTGVVNIGPLTGGGVSNINFGISNDPAVLPVVYAAVSATLQDGQLNVKWTTNSETNNRKFDVQASADGQNFTTIGEVITLAPDGTSATPLDYEFVKSIAGTAFGMGWGIGLLMIATGFVGYIKGRKLIARLVTLVGFGLIVTGCAQKEMNTGNMGKIMIRIVQTDKDGTQTTSKTVQVISKD